MNHTWLILTDFNGLTRTRILPDSLGTKSTLFPGIFTTDVFDVKIPEIPNADETRIMKAVPDRDSIRMSPWFNCHFFVFADAFSNDNPSKVCPRTMVKNVIHSFTDMHLHVKVGVELEWTILRPDNSFTDNCTFSSIPLQDPVIQKYISTVLESCIAAEIDIESMQVESGRNMLEVALSPTDAVRAADNVQLFKWIAKREAQIYDLCATFHPKPFPDSAGCGTHLHVSIHGDDERKDLDNVNQSFLAGLLRCIRDTTCMYLPFEESYHRILGDFWTCSDVNYGYEDRTCTVRTISEPQRMETRLGGADMNPYLGIYSMLASGLFGIQEKFSLNEAPNESCGKIPTTLIKATTLFTGKQSEARNLFGDAFVEHYGATRLHECLAKPSRTDDWLIQLV